MVTSSTAAPGVRRSRLLVTVCCRWIRRRLIFERRECFSPMHLSLLATFERPVYLFKQASQYLIVIPAKAGIHAGYCAELSLSRHIFRMDVNGFRPSPE